MKRKIKKTSSCWPRFSIVEQGNKLSHWPRDMLLCPCSTYGPWELKRLLVNTQKNKPTGGDKAQRDTDLLSSRLGVELCLAPGIPASLAGIRSTKDPFSKHDSSIQSPALISVSLDLGARVRAWYDLQQPRGCGERKETKGQAQGPRRPEL